MTRILLGAMLALGLLACSGQPLASAGGALIETTAPLADHSEASVKAAVITAIDKAVRGAAAMGFAWFELRDAQISGNEVAIQILAGAEDAARLDESDPGAESDPTEDDDAPADEPRPGLPVSEASRLHI